MTGGSGESQVAQENASFPGWTWWIPQWKYSRTSSSSAWIITIRSPELRHPVSYCGIVAPTIISVMFQRCLAIDVGCWKLPKATHQIVPQQFAKVITTHVIQVVTWGEHVVSHPKIRMGSWFEECCTEMPRSNETAQKKQYHIMARNLTLHQKQAEQRK